MVIECMTFKIDQHLLILNCVFYIIFIFGSEDNLMI